MKKNIPYLAIVALAFTALVMFLAEFNFFSEPITRTQSSFAAMSADKEATDRWPVYAVRPCFTEVTTKEGLPGQYDDTFCPGLIYISVPHEDSLYTWVKPPEFAPDAKLRGFASKRLVKPLVPEKLEPPLEEEEADEFEYPVKKRLENQ